MSGRLGERLALFQKWPGILPAPNLRPARASLPFCEFYFSRGIFLAPPILAPPPRPPPGPPGNGTFFKKGGPLFSWLHRKIKKIPFSGGPRKWNPLFLKKASPFFPLFGNSPENIFYFSWAPPPDRKTFLASRPAKKLAGRNAGPPENA